MAEFAETFPIVCGDFSFYQFPTPEFWKKLFATAPPQLQFALKVPEEVTVEVFPRHPRYGPRAGRTNEAYLNADAFRAQFLEPLEPYRSRIACLIFEFGARGATGLPHGCNCTRAEQRPARSDREELAISLAETADHDRAFRLVANQPDKRDIEDLGDLLGDNRAISCDSRYWGPIKGSSIVGEVVLLWWHDGHPDLHWF